QPTAPARVVPRRASRSPRSIGRRPLRLLGRTTKDLGGGLVESRGQIVGGHALRNLLHLADPAPALAARRALGAGNVLLELRDREPPLFEQRVLDSLGPRELPHREQQGRAAFR